MARRPTHVPDRRDSRPAAGRVFGYARVSGAEQGKHGSSLEAQQTEIRRYCEFHSLPAPTFFVEVESGAREKLERRVELARIEATAKRGDTVLVTKVDRWSRDLSHGVSSVRALVARGVRWIAISDSIDAATSHGDSTLGIMAWAADHERKTITGRMVGGRKALRDQGQYVEGRRPIGYQRGPGRKLVVDAAESDIIKALFQRVAEGESLNAVVRSISRDFGFKRDKAGFHRMLRNRVYLGEVANAAGDWIAAHEPIINKALWARAGKALVERRLSGRAPSDTARTATWLLRSVAHCALCARRMGSAYKTNRDGSLTDYYICCGRLAKSGCKGRYVRVDAADAAVSAMALERLRELQVQLSAPPSDPARKVTRDTAADRRRIEQRRERLIDLAESGDITKAALRHRLERLDAELYAIEQAEEVANARASARAPAARRELLRDMRALEECWAYSTIDSRRAIVTRLAERIALSANAPPAITWRSVDDLVANSSSQ